MLDVNTAVQKFSSLIQARSNSRNITSMDGNLVNSPLRVIGELMLNKFASQISTESVMAEQRTNVRDEILENVVNSFALAGILGIDLSKELNELIDLLESVSAEAS